MLSGVAEEAIVAAGLDPNFGAHNTFAGAAFHRPDGTSSYLGKWSPKGESFRSICLTDRFAISDHLVSETQRVYPSVQFHHAVKLVAGNLAAGELEFVDGKGDQLRVSGDLIVGADGAGSTVRRLLQEQEPSFTATRDRAYFGIKAFLVEPPSKPYAFEEFATPSGKPFHYVPPGGPPPPHGNTVAFMHPQLRKDQARTVWGMGILCQQDSQKVSLSLSRTEAWWAQERTEAQLLAELRDLFPHAPDVWLQEAAKQCHSGAPGFPTYPSTVTCNKFGHGRVMLVGDAAHAVTPALGMGANSSILDALLLARCVQAVGGDLGQLAEAWTAARLDDARALMRMERSVFDLQFFQVHKSWSKLVAAVPMILTMSLSTAQAKLPDWLKPKNPMFAVQSGRRLKDIEQDIRGYAMRAGLVCVALLGILVFNVVA